MARQRTATKFYDPQTDGLNDNGRLGKVTASKKKRGVKKVIEKKQTKATNKTKAITKTKASRTSKKKNKRVLVSGCYDLLHSGHVAFFKEASAHGDLYVSVGSDANVTQLKKVPLKTYA